MNGTHFADHKANYLRDTATATTSMIANWPSSSGHPAGMSARVLDDSSSDDYSAPPSDMEYGDGVCDDATKVRSSLFEFEKMSPQHLAVSSQAVPPALADISILARHATIPTREYARFADLSNCGGKLNLLSPLTDVTRGTLCSNVHQCDTIRDTAHEYDTLRGEKCLYKLLGAEERVVPSLEVNSGPSPPRNDDDGFRLVPQGRTHIDDSITTLQSPEADRYFGMTLSGDTSERESLALREINETLALNANNELLSSTTFAKLSGFNELLPLNGNKESLMLGGSLDSQTLKDRNESLSTSESFPIVCSYKESLSIKGKATLTFGANESLMRSCVNELLPLSVMRKSQQLSCFNESLKLNAAFTLSCTKMSLMFSEVESLNTDNGYQRCRERYVLFSGTSESPTLRRENSVQFCGNDKLLTLSGINESSGEHFTVRSSSDQNVPILKRCSNMVDAAVQTDPVEAPPVGIKGERLGHIAASRERGVECVEQVPTSASPDDTCQLVATAVRMIAPDGFPGAASGGGEGIDLRSPAFKWNDGKRPRSVAAAAAAAAATQVSLTSNKRMRLRLGLSRRARPPPLHTKAPNGL